MTNLERAEYLQTIDFCYRLKAYLSQQSEDRLILIQTEKNRNNLHPESLAVLRTLRDEIFERIAI